MVGVISEVEVILMEPPPPHRAPPSVSTFHPTPPQLMSGATMGGVPVGHPLSPPHAGIVSSFSSSCGSSSSTTGSVSGGGGVAVNDSGGGLGVGCGGGIGDNSSRCSGGSSSISGSNSRLNLNPSALKTPIQTIPPPLSSSSSLYQVHDGFATVRKRKGPSAAAIAMRQQEEIYDLALAQPIPTTPPVVPFSSTPLQFSRGGNIKTRHSFMIGKSTFAPSPVIGNGNSNGNSNNSCQEKKSASLLSTHHSLNLGRPKEPFMNGNGYGMMMRSPSPVTSPVSGVGPCGSPTCHGRPWPLSCDCPCICTCNCHVSTISGQQEHGKIAAPPNHLSSSSSSSTASSIHKARANSAGKGTPTNSNSSLGRKLRRFVLPTKSNNSNRSTSKGDGLTSPSPPPPPHSIHQFHSSFESVPILEPTMVTIRKSPSASASLGSGQYYPSQAYSPEGIQHQTQPGRTLRNSISDNSISAGLLHRAVTVQVPNGVEAVPPPSPSPSSSVGSNGSHSARHFHRSCFLPKAPPLEPVMEDGIPWRQTRKDVPWWELAIRRGRYRSCPILQATPQVWKPNNNDMRNIRADSKK